MRNYIQKDAQRIKDSLPPGTSIPERSDALFEIYAVLLRSKGSDVTAADVHDAWSAWMTAQDPDHKSIRPYDELDKETRDEDQPFLSAIKEALNLAGR